jgi:transposase-like protein
MTKLNYIRENFNTELACLEFLAELKWKNGFVCKKCNHKEYYKGQKHFDRKCKACDHNESPTSGTLFHKVKFSLVQAFEMIYWLTQTKKGMSSTELSRHFGLQQKTCWLFKRKVQIAMEQKGEKKLSGNIEVDEFVIGGLEKKAQGRSLGKKKIAIVAIETTITKKGKKGIKRAFCTHIDGYSGEDFKPFFKERINEDSKIKSDKWTGYYPLKGDYKIRMVYSKTGTNFKELHNFIMNLKGWMRGIHHSISSWHYQAYLDEFCFRFNNRFGDNKAFFLLIENMMLHSKVYYKNLVFGI